MRDKVASYTVKESATNEGKKGIKNHKFTQSRDFIPPKISCKAIEKFNRYIHMSQSHVWKNYEKVDYLDQDLIHREQIEGCC